MNEAVFLHGARDARVALFNLREGRPGETLIVSGNAFNVFVRTKPRPPSCKANRAITASSGTSHISDKVAVAHHRVELLHLAAHVCQELLAASSRRGESLAALMPASVGLKSAM
jgi:hypothetical protein